MSDKLFDSDLWEMDWTVQSQTLIDSSDWWDKRWKYRIPVKVRGERVNKKEITWRLQLDPVKFMEKTGLSGEFNRDSVRVIGPSGEPVPSAFYYDPYFRSWKGIGWTLVWNFEAPVKRDDEQIYYVYFDNCSKPIVSDLSVNAIKNGSFKDGLSSRWTILNNAKCISIGSFPELDSDLVDKAGFKIDINADNIGILGEEPIILSQKVDALGLAGKRVLFSSSLYLEKGKGGCPIEIKLVSYDAKGAICDEQVLAAFTLAQGQLMRLNAPGYVVEDGVMVGLFIKFSPAMKEETEYSQWRQVVDSDAYLSLNLTDVRLRPGLDVEIASGTESPYKEGKFPDTPVNLGVEFTDQRSIMFNTFPKVKGSNGAGEPVRFNIWKGTVECWVKPYWDYNDGIEHAIFWGGHGWRRHPHQEGRSGKGVSFIVTKRGEERENRLEISFTSGGQEEHVAYAIVKFEKDNWYHIAATWDLNEGTMGLFVNGEKVASLKEDRAWALDGIPEVFEIGNRSGVSKAEWYSRTFHGVIDEFRISDSIRYHEDFEPIDEEFELDEDTCSLFHFQGFPEGIDKNGEPILVMTSFETLYENKSFFLDQLSTDGVTRTMISAEGVEREVSQRRLEENRPAWMDVRLEYVPKRPDFIEVEYRFKEHEEIVYGDSEAFNIEVGGDIEPLTRFLELEALGREDLITEGVRLLRTGKLDTSSLDTIINTLITPDMTDSEKAEKIFEFVMKFIFWWRVPHEHGGKFVEDSVKKLNTYGTSMCSSHSLILADLWIAAGLSARIMGVYHHVAPEVYYEGDWHLMDMTFGTYALERDDMTIASVDDIMEDHYIAHRLHNGEGYNALLGNARNWAYRLLFYHTEKSRMRMRTLNMGTKVGGGSSYLYQWHNKGKWNNWTHTPERKLEEWFAPWHMSNGEYVFEPILSEEGLHAAGVVLKNARVEDSIISIVNPHAPGEVLLKQASDYVICGGRLFLSFNGDGGEYSIDISIDGGITWQEMASGSSKVEDAIDLGEKVVGVHSYLVRITLNGTIKLTGIRLRTYTQMYQKSLPSLTLGRNKIRFRAEKVGAPVSVKYGWIERYISPVKLWVDSVGYWSTNEEFYNALVPCDINGTELTIHATGEGVKGAKISVEGLPEGWNVELENEVIKDEIIDTTCFVKPPSYASSGIYPFRVKLVADGLTRTAYGILLLTRGIAYLSSDMMEGAVDELSLIEDRLAPSGQAFQGKGHCRFSISKAGEYQLWARLKGSGMSNGSVLISLDGAPSKKCGVGDYHGLAPSENGLDWMWAAGDIYHLSEGEHMATVITNGNTCAGGFLLVKIDEELQVTLERLFLNRLYRPWGDMENL